MPTLVLLRHGRSTANTSGVLAGWTPGVHLDDVGRSQAESVGRRLADAAVLLALVATSPLERCRETAVLAAPGHLRESHEVHDGLGECRYGTWTGRALGELTKEPLWRVIQDAPSTARFPDGEDFAGESISQMSERAVTAVRELDEQVRRAAGADAVWLAVSHGDVIKAVLADALGTPLDEFQRIVVDPGSVSIIRYTERRPMVLRVNDAGGDLGLLAPKPAGEGPGTDDNADAKADADAAIGGIDAGDGVIGGGAGPSSRVET